MLWRSFLAALRHGALVTVLGMEMVVDVPTEVGRAVKPRASANEGAAGEPLGAVVTIRGAAIRSRIIVTVRAFRSCADFYADLGLCFGSICCEAKTSNSS